jgi:hypothetical protein
MTLFTRHRSAKRACIVSLIALGGSFLAWAFWASRNGWPHHDHWGEAALWSLCAAVGFWATINAIRFDRMQSVVSFFAALLGILHALSSLLLWAFVAMWARGVRI